MSEIYNFQDHKKGDTFKGITFRITKNGETLDLTNATIKMSLKKDKSSIVSVLDLSTINTKIIILTPATSGAFQIPPQIISVPAATYYYDIQLTLASGEVSTYIEGSWKILQDITN
jgi:hypothetical protein